MVLYFTDGRIGNHKVESENKNNFVFTELNLDSLNLLVWLSRRKNEQKIKENIFRGIIGDFYSTYSHEQLSEYWQ